MKTDRHSDNHFKEYEGEEYQQKLNYASVMFFIIREPKYN